MNQSTAIYKARKIGVYRNLGFACSSKKYLAATEDDPIRIDPADSASGQWPHLEAPVLCNPRLRGHCNKNGVNLKLIIFVSVIWQM